MRGLLSLVSPQIAPRAHCTAAAETAYHAPVLLEETVRSLHAKIGEPAVANDFCPERLCCTNSVKGFMS